MKVLRNSFLSSVDGCRCFVGFSVSCVNGCSYFVTSPLSSGCIDEVA